MATDHVPEDRFCDLVMKGGITSGVVYPPAIFELAQHYRFKNIGGTSAGAIAAAATAAAEYRRRMQGTSDGFEALKALPDKLKEKGHKGKTQLLRLFQPDPPCRRLFTILVTALNARHAYQRAALVAWGCLKGYWPALFLSLALTTLAAWVSRSVLATLLAALGGTLACVGVAIYRDATREVVGNNYGLCKGLTTRPKDGPALTDWLHELIQKTAGLPLDEPLTFRHLWHARGFPPPSIPLTQAEQASTRSINLQMFTTNLSHGRPYVFPHTEVTARLFFREEDLKAYLPHDVLKLMMAKSIPYAPSKDAPKSDPAPAELPFPDLREIADPADFPVLLATRMSLSFPLLFSAVPLWAIDYEAPLGHRQLRRCFFSDGGISSNFPVHLFDGLLPSWPTFGIKLEPALRELPKSLIFLPHEYGQGIADTWDRFDEQEGAALKLGRFLASIVGAMQNWNDNTLARAAGVRDRVVRLRLNKNEGGLNLNMDPHLIDEIAKRGRTAAVALTHRFHAAPRSTLPIVDPRVDLLPHRASASAGWAGWDFQRWVRLDVLIRTLMDKAPGLFRGLDKRVPHSDPYDDLLRKATLRAPPGHAQPLSSGQAQALDDLLKALRKFALEFADAPPKYPDAPIPSSEIRVRPTL